MGLQCFQQGPRVIWGSHTQSLIAMMGVLATLPAQGPLQPNNNSISADAAGSADPC